MMEVKTKIMRRLKKVGRKWDNFPHISAQKKAAAATSAAV